MDVVSLSAAPSPMLGGVLSSTVDDRRPTVARIDHRLNPASAGAALLAAMVGNFMIILDAVIVNVALPSVQTDFGGGISGLQWVVDGYTLLFAALLMASGAVSDRIGARRAFAAGLGVFVVASAACGLAPGLGTLVLARLVQGGAAAVMMPASLALIGQAYPDPIRRGRAIAMWAVGGAVAASSGPVLGGLLTLTSWRWIFIVNVPAGLLATAMLVRVERSPRRPAAFDGFGLATAVVAMGALTYGAIEAGTKGFTDPTVLTAFLLAAAALSVFLVVEQRSAHPMVPLQLFRSRNLSVAAVVAFAFMACYYGLPFVMSLYLQQLRGLSSFQTGLVFLPMMLSGTAVTPFSARLAERFGARRLTISGMTLMALGLTLLAGLVASIPIGLLAGLMALVGVAGPLVMPPITTVVLNSVSANEAGTASGVFNTSRQVGGALAVAVFGGLLAHEDHFLQGLRTSLLLAAGAAVAAAVASRLLRPASATAAPIHDLERLAAV
jgi:EmrB/QacA subfamily drug resistance transporter